MLASRIRCIALEKQRFERGVFCVIVKNCAGNAYSDLGARCVSVVRQQVGP